MDQLKDFADGRLIVGRIYCGGLDETRDHVPSRVFLDSPFPENLPVVPACGACNTSFSRDEEYVACLIESAVVGSTDPDCIRRPRVADMLRRSPALRSQIEAGKYMENGQIVFGIDTARVQNVILKLARGHAAYELSALCRQEPTALRCWPICIMTDEQRDAFDASHVKNVSPSGTETTLDVYSPKILSRLPRNEIPETLLHLIDRFENDVELSGQEQSQ